jgi:predicted transcriptional regulator
MSETISSVRVVERLSESKAAVTVRRSQLETRIDMLRAIHEGAEGPTQVMYKANLSWSALQENLSKLIAVGLLTEEKFGSRRRYVLTDKGMGVLRNFEIVLEEIDGSPHYPKSLL